MFNIIREKYKFFLLITLLVIMCSTFLSYDKTFQADSETLVTGPLRAREIQADMGTYPLGRYIAVDGKMMDYSRKEISEEWKDGYSSDEAAFIISNNKFTKEFIKKLAIIKDKNGNEFIVDNVVFAGDYIRINLTSNVRLKKDENGDITELQYFDTNGMRLPAGKVSDYKSQFGLQGIMFNHIAPKGMSYKTVRNLARGACIVLLAVVLIMICYLVGIKYNWWLSGVFFATFCTSPWIVNFAPNLYWVEFTWFIPMLIGLAVSVTNMNCKYRVLAYLGALIAITVKCLCGYEYISTIIIGMLMFPLVEGMASWRNGDVVRAKKCFRLTFGLCVVGVMGFIIALAMHGYMRGMGDIAVGLQDIYQKDVLRRTWGGDAANYAVYGEAGMAAISKSLSASAFTVMAKYLMFKTTIVLGIPGFMFILFALSPLFIKWYYQKHSMILPWNHEVWALYILGFIATTSWLMLAKAHSYIHTHMNYVLWYFGFVQVCLYCVVMMLKDRIIYFIKYYGGISKVWQERLGK